MVSIKRNGVRRCGIFLKARRYGIYLKEWSEKIWFINVWSEEIWYLKEWSEKIWYLKKCGEEIRCLKERSKEIWYLNLWSEEIRFLNVLSELSLNSGPRCWQGQFWPTSGPRLFSYLFRNDKF